MDKLTVRESWLDDWWVIETVDGRRICGADVEGTAAEMLSIAETIERRDRVLFGRCAVCCYPDGSVGLWSPRNSVNEGYVPYGVAADLAR